MRQAADRNVRSVAPARDTAIVEHSGSIRSRGNSQVVGVRGADDAHRIIVVGIAGQVESLNLNEGDQVAIQRDVQIAGRRGLVLKRDGSGTVAEAVDIEIDRVRVPCIACRSFASDSQAGS